MRGVKSMTHGNIGKRVKSITVDKTETRAKVVNYVKESCHIVRKRSRKTMEQVVNTVG